MGARADNVFRAIADPTRRRILITLGSGPRNVGELCSDFEIRQPSVSAHLQVLRTVGLVTVRNVGRHRVYSLRATPLVEVADWVTSFERFWNDALRRLGGALDDDAADQVTAKPGRRRRGS
jgi:DNA-binding transcriptional ArsR family regulator